MLRGVLESSQNMIKHDELVLLAGFNATLVSATLNHHTLTLDFVKNWICGVPRRKTQGNDKFCSQAEVVFCCGGFGYPLMVVQDGIGALLAAAVAAIHGRRR